jgi:hypothetical protein
VYLDGALVGSQVANGEGLVRTLGAGAHQLRVVATGTNTPVVPARTVRLRAGTLAKFYVVSDTAGANIAALAKRLQLGSGYRLVAADGGVFTYGNAQFFGSAGNLPLVSPIVGGASTVSQNGYWMVAADGGVFAFGDARFFGSTATLPLRAPVVGMAPTPSGLGYWLATADGGVFAFGDATFAGSLGATQVAAPIAGITPTRTGDGYFLLARNGAVYAFGDARYRGGASQAGTSAVALSAPASGTDYWIAFANGGRTELAATRSFLFPKLPTLLAPVVSMLTTPSADGVWLACSDGGVFALGEAGFFGAAAGLPLRAPVVAVI